MVNLKFFKFIFKKLEDLINSNEFFESEILVSDLDFWEVYKDNREQILFGDVQEWQINLNIITKKLQMTPCVKIFYLEIPEVKIFLKDDEDLVGLNFVDNLEDIHDCLIKSHRYYSLYTETAKSLTVYQRKFTHIIPKNQSIQISTYLASIHSNGLKLAAQVLVDILSKIIKMCATESEIAKLNRKIQYLYENFVLYK
ncbi:unnamed protein product [Chironomus riparius]|uniref:Uncharacterized protein n=1 Tax=Chironomus riparius TaxID=315576 RepID=A0A9N9RQD7_9DIPT|nr:unnamed protein product [Chironomus riparius]